MPEQISRISIRNIDRRRVWLKNKELHTPAARRVGLGLDRWKRDTRNERRVCVPGNTRTASDFG